MVQPWFRRFTHAVEPASPHFHPCFSQAPLRHGPRVFGEGHKFPLKEEVVVHDTCNPDTTLALETPEWRWLADVTPKYMFCRAMTLWMKKHRQEDKDGVQS